MAVTAIIVVVTSVVLVNNNRFGGIVQLENLAYDVALSIRQAQVYSISVQRSGTDCSAPDAKCFESGYGMYFNTGLPQNYTLFADTQENGLYDGGEENISPYTIRSGFKINALCAPEDSCLGVSKLDIVFKRPEADAYIRKNGESTPISSARIVLLSPRGDQMSVIVDANGQISVRHEGTP